MQLWPKLDPAYQTMKTGLIVIERSKQPILVDCFDAVISLAASFCCIGGERNEFLVAQLQQTDPVRFWPVLSFRAGSDSIVKKQVPKHTGPFCSILSHVDHICQGLEVQ